VQKTGHVFPKGTKKNGQPLSQALTESSIFISVISTVACVLTRRNSCDLL